MMTLTCDYCGLGRLAGTDLRTYSNPQGGGLDFHDICVVAMRAKASEMNTGNKTPPSN